jgi:hypothetical protein
MSLRKRRKLEYKKLWRAKKRAEFEAGNPRNCMVCGGPMPPGSRIDRWYCSDACRQKNHRDLRNEYFTNQETNRIIP